MQIDNYLVQRDVAWNTVLVDPGASGALPTENSGAIPVVTAAVETRTLADPTTIGQELLIYMKTDGGDCTITVATAFNAGGDATVVLNDAGDFVLFKAIESGSDVIWRLVASGGVPEIAAVDVGITDTGSLLVATEVEAALQELALAATITIADSGSLITATETEAALQELAQHNQSIQKFLNLPLGSWHEVDGTALLDFGADGDTPGFEGTAKNFGIRWHNRSNPDPISTSIPYPADLDPAANVIVHILAWKTGNTVGDAVIWKIEAFENIDGALYDADTDFGGDSSAMTGNATAKTCQEETLTLANANITGSPGVFNLTLQPKDGTLGTDDVIVLGVWLEYKGKTLTA